MNQSDLQVGEGITKDVNITVISHKAIENQRSNLLLSILVQQKYRATIQQSFIKLVLYRNGKNKQKMAAKYLTSIIKSKVRNRKIQALAKIKLAAHRSKAVSVFAKILKGVASGKKCDYLTSAFTKLKVNSLKKALLEQNSKQEKEKKILKVTVTEVKMKESMDRINEHLKEKQHDSAKKEIDKLLKLYGKGEVQSIYEAFSESMETNKQNEQYFHEISKIIEIFQITLDQSEADGSGKDLVKYRKNSDKEFKIIQSKYENSEKAAAQVVAQIADKMKMLKNNLLEAMSVKKQIILNQKKRVAQLLAELQQSKAKVTKSKKDEASQQFSKNIERLKQKMKKGQSWSRELQALKEDKAYNNEKPYSQVLEIVKILQQSFISETQFQYQQLKSLLQSITTIFQSETASEETKMSEVSKACQIAIANHPYISLFEPSIHNLIVSIISHNNSKSRSSSKQGTSFYQQLAMRIIDEQSQIFDYIQIFETQLSEIVGKIKNSIDWKEDIAQFKTDERFTCHELSSLFYEFYECMESRLLQSEEMKATEKEIEGIKTGLFALLNESYSSHQERVSQIFKFLEKAENSENRGFIGNIKGLIGERSDRKNIEKLVTLSRGTETETSQAAQILSTVETARQQQSELNAVMKFMEASEQQIKGLPYQETMWNRIFDQLEIPSNSVISPVLISFMNIVDFLTNKILEADIEMKEAIERLGLQIREQSSENWGNLKNRGINEFVIKYSQVWRGKFANQRKSTENSIKSYEKQMEKLSNLINQYEKDLKEKDKDYQELYDSYVELQKSSRRRSSSSSSRNSNKSSEIQDMKKSMESHIEQQKKMLQKIQGLEDKNFELLALLKFHENQLIVSRKYVEQMELQCKQLGRLKAQQQESKRVLIEKQGEIEALKANLFDESKHVHISEYEELKVQFKIQQQNRNKNQYKNSEQAASDFDQKLFRDRIEQYERKLSETIDLLFQQNIKLKNQLMSVSIQNNDLLSNFDNVNNKMKELEIRSQELLQKQMEKWERKTEKLRQDYEQKIANYAIEIISLKREHHANVANFNHSKCEEKQSKYEKEIYDLQLKVSESDEEMRVLQNMIDNQRSGLNKLEELVDLMRGKVDSVEQQKITVEQQKINYENEMSAQIQRLKSEYQASIEGLQNEKIVLLEQIDNYDRLINNQSFDEFQRLMQLETEVTQRNLQVRLLDEKLDNKVSELEDEKQRVYSLLRECENLKSVNLDLKFRVSKLQSELSTLNAENVNYKTKLYSLQNRQIFNKQKAKTGSEGSTKYLKSEVGILRNQILEMDTESCSSQKSHNFYKIQHLIREAESQRKCKDSDDIEFEILRIINKEVADLVQSNRLIQIKCQMLQSQSNSSPSPSKNHPNFALALEDSVEDLITYLIRKSLICNKEIYYQFLLLSRRCLQENDFEEYFNYWLNFMKALFLTVNNRNNEESAFRNEQLTKLVENLSVTPQKLAEYKSKQFQTCSSIMMINSRDVL